MFLLVINIRSKYALILTVQTLDPSMLRYLQFPKHGNSIAKVVVICSRKV